MIDILFGISATDWSEILRNYALGIAAILTSYVALNGLNSWKDQQEWNEKRKAAIEALLAIEKLERVLQNSLFNPFSDEQFIEIIPEKTKFEGIAFAVATTIEENINGKISELQDAVKEFEKSLVPAAIIFDASFKSTTRRVTSWIGVFLAELTQVSLVAKFPMLSQENSRNYIEKYRSETFSSDQAKEIPNHPTLRLLNDLEGEIRALGGVAA